MPKREDAFLPRGGRFPDIFGPETSILHGALSSIPTGDAGDDTGELMIYD